MLWLLESPEIKNGKVILFAQTSVKDEKTFEFPRRITVNYETLCYFHERAKTEEKSFPTMYLYAYEARSCIFSMRQWRIVTSCIALSFISSVHCQKNKKDEDKKDEEFKCPEGQGNGNFADPATCRRFYQVIHIIINLSGNNYISHMYSNYFYYRSTLDYLSPLRLFALWLYVYTLFSESASMDILTWIDVRRACISTTSASSAPSKMRRDADRSRPVSEHFYFIQIKLRWNKQRQDLKRKLQIFKKWFSSATIVTFWTRCS